MGTRSSAPDHARSESLDQPTEAQLQNRLTTAYAMLRLYTTSERPTRPLSPRSDSTRDNYLRELGRLSPVTCDRLIINTFIGLFQVYVAPTLPCFTGRTVDSSTPEEVYLAMAAVGGLYCEAPKSEIIAKWLFHTAQRKLLSMVRGIPLKQSVVNIMIHPTDSVFQLHSGASHSSERRWAFMQSVSSIFWPYSDEPLLED